MEEVTLTSRLRPNFFSLAAPLIRRFGAKTQLRNMINSPQNPKEKSPSNETSERIPKQVWLAAWLAVVGAVVAGAVAIVNGGVTSATHLWSVGVPCFSIAGMMAVVCYAIVRYR